MVRRNLEVLSQLKPRELEDVRLEWLGDTYLEVGNEVSNSPG